MPTSKPIPFSNFFAAMVMSVLTCFIAAGDALASYPDKTITIVVPFSAGGPTDKTARDLGESIKKFMGAPSVVVDNVVGAGGTIAATKVIRSAPDGYTLFLAHIGLATSYALYPKLAYNNTDFEYLGVISEVPMVLMGRPTLPAANIPDLIQMIKDSKGGVTLAHAGSGSASHLCALLVQSHLKLQMTGIPYKGTGPAMSDLLGGHVDLVCDQSITAAPQIDAGRVKAYGVTTLTRSTASPAMAKVPTLDEAGVSGLNLTVWQALYAPKGTPQPVLAMLNNAVRAALKDPEFIKRQQSLGVQIVTDDRLTPAGHKRLMDSEIAKWTKIIKAAGVYAEE